MCADFTLNAQARTAPGRGESRRLRRRGRVPGVIYGGHGETFPISVAHNELERNLEYEAFYSQIIQVTIDGKKEEVLLKDLQRHPAKTKLIHFDLQRVVAGEAITVQIPVHYIGEEEAPGVVQDDGVVERHLNEIEITCLPRDIPEYIEVEISGMHVEDIIHLSDIQFPPGVESVDLAHEQDETLVAIHHPRVEEEPEEEELEAAAGEAPEAEESGEGEEGRSEEGESSGDDSN
jgi:large subunit ribosomal protein L25